MPSNVQTAVIHPELGLSPNANVLCLVMSRARLGPKAVALAWLEAARALQISGPSQSPQQGPGSGLAWLRPQLLAEKYICI